MKKKKDLVSSVLCFCSVVLDVIGTFGNTKMQTFERFLGEFSLIPGGLNCIHKLLNYIQVYTEQKQMKCPSMISTVAAFFARSLSLK